MILSLALLALSAAGCGKKAEPVVVPQAVDTARAGPATPGPTPQQPIQPVDTEGGATRTALLADLADAAQGQLDADRFEHKSGHARELAVSSRRTGRSSIARRRS